MNADEGRERVIVDSWDGLTRILHWSIALLTIALALSMFAKDGLGALDAPREVRRPFNTIHGYIGYIFVAFFSLRIIWGFAGNKYARWSDIIPVTGEQRRRIGENIRWYFSGFKSKLSQVVGHSPLASIFYMALFVVLAMMAITGILLTGVELDMFPGTLFTSGLSEEAAEGVEGFCKEVHEFGNWFLVFFFFVHLGGIVSREIKTKAGLLSSMVHGKKYMMKGDL